MGTAQCICPRRRGGGSSVAIPGTTAPFVQLGTLRRRSWSSGQEYCGRPCQRPCDCCLWSSCGSVLAATRGTASPSPSSAPRKTCSPDPSCAFRRRHCLVETVRQPLNSRSPVRTDTHRDGDSTTSRHWRQETRFRSSLHLLSGDEVVVLPL